MSIIPPFGAIAQAWTGRYKSIGDPGHADCVIGFSFAYRGKLSISQGLRSQASARVAKRERAVQPGLSNEDLAYLASRHFNNLPKILQFEIADAHALTEDTNQKQLVRIEKHRKAGLYLDSREVAEQAAKVMKKHGWHRPILLAHPNHMPRVYAVCRHLGMDPIVTAEERGAVEFDLRSSQKWTRKLTAWREYEPLVLIYYWLKGWV